MLACLLLKLFFKASLGMTVKTVFIGATDCNYYQGLEAGEGTAQIDRS
jgi:hypothetical protein